MNESAKSSITKIDLTVKKEIFSVPIANNLTITEVLIDYQMESYEKNEKNLTKNLTNELTELFGKQNKSLRLEYLTKLWVLKYEDLIFNVYTSKKGTAIEICDYTYDEIRKGEKQNKIIDFLECLYSLINDISPEELELRKATRKYNL